MTRRALLASLAGAFAGGYAAGEVEKLLWTPGKKLISIPAPRIVQPYQRHRLGDFVFVKKPARFAGRAHFPFCAPYLPLYDYQAVMLTTPRLVQLASEGNLDALLRRWEKT